MLIEAKQAEMPAALGGSKLHERRVLPPLASVLSTQGFFALRYEREVVPAGSFAVRRASRHNIAGAALADQLSQAVRVFLCFQAPN